ncbi:DEAD/DEAH box helicase [Saccharopolyspora indica]|uniref:DEAD/DEAH box helicase n=1 Tax=Saccharopolyspora indica TaxID=1229659 RepID=UPI0022EA6E6D|nr:DEAD/DEAH box helicase [Saccharopolyspora indica]MDA3646639.1 DEAD/DEAH box helicase [Saccharopolyspora indica]
MFRKVYDGPRKQGRDRAGLLAAVVCPRCPATFQLRDLGLRTYAQLMDGSSRSRPNCDAGPGVTVQAIPARHAAAFVDELMNGARVVAAEPRLLHWVKTSDPDVLIARQPPGTDVRVLLPLEPGFDALARRLDADGIPHRRVRYWVEDEAISTVGPGGRLAHLRVTPESTPQGAIAARDAFELMWETHDDVPGEGPVDAVVPGEWLPYLPHPTLNPAQAQAAPTIVGTDSPVIITAPTDAGKTVIGMMAVLKAMLQHGRKAAWLVPQRSLTAELDRELGRWRALGIRVERLSGDYAIDRQRIRDADVWVATTEKFESLCRTASLRTALEQVGCLVVDEIHLLGDPHRGPVLEALLARFAENGAPVRMVGLSATVSNAADIASWLRAELITTTWRPTRLTWQLPVIPDTGDRKADQDARTRLAVALTARITADAGSVLVFCGSKHNVRATALALARARGANTDDVAADDLERLERVCTSVGIGIHYKDWEHKHAAEQGFRDRELDVLVATTTVAAGVNLPARAVIVRDTQLGTATIDTATVQQMFGRAGRIGAGEIEGWAYLINTAAERATWQRQLTAGYAVRSQIAANLPDHLLAELAQDRIRTTADAQLWWQQTLAHHQGDQDSAPVQAAVEQLLRHGYLTQASSLTVTDLGHLTTRLMINVRTGNELIAALAGKAAPETPQQAEELLSRAVADCVPAFAEAPIADNLRPRVAEALRAVGGSTSQADGAHRCEPGDLAQCAFLLVASTPRAFAGSPRAIAGLPLAALQPILAEAPRYFSWLAEQGHLGTVHPWIAITAADLGRRIRWRSTAPPRGAGRLLWICEQLATPEHADHLIPRLYRAAREAGHTAPDWPHTTPPRDCRLNHTSYQSLLRARATGTRFTTENGRLSAHLPGETTIAAWTGANYTIHTSSAGHAACPNGSAAVAFTPRGDYYAHGWPTVYNAIDSAT